MDDAPGLSALLTDWSFDAAWAVLIALAGYWYMTRARRLAAMHPRVPHRRRKTVAFMAGLVFVTLAVMSPIHEYGDRLLWVNFTGFLLLTMVAPLLLAAGSPLTLAFRGATPAGRSKLLAFYRSRFISACTFPFTTWLLFAAVTYIWQFSTLTEIAARNWVVRDIQQFTLLFVGLAFWYVALAADPLRWRMGHPLRVLFVGLEMVHKSLFGGMFLAMSTPFHNQFANNLPEWGPSPMMDQRMAILILWIGGNVVFVAAIAGLIAGWLSYEARNQHRVDQRMERAKEAARRRRAALEQVFTKSI